MPSAGVQVGADYWGKGSAELRVEMLSGYLCTGCLDKGQYGRHGLLHAVQASACCNLSQKLSPLLCNTALWQAPCAHLSQGLEEATVNPASLIAQRRPTLRM